MSGFPVTVVDSGGLGVTAVDSGAAPATAVDAGGFPITLMDSGGVPMVIEGLFSPAELFASSEVGGFYDPSDLSSMWQDSAATTPAAVDSPVGRLDDKSGNNNHLQQTTAGARPVLRESGGIYWLEFDGVDAGMISAATRPWVANGYTASAGVELASATANNHIFDADLDGVNARLAQLLRGHSTTVARTIAFNLTNTSFVASSPAIAAATPMVLTGLCSEVSTFARRDGTAGADAGFTGALKDGSQFLTLGYRTTSFTNMKFFGGVVIDRALSAGELSALEGWLAGKAGA